MECAKRYVLDALERAPEGIAEEDIALQVSDFCGADDSWGSREGALLTIAAQHLAASSQVAVRDRNGAWTYFALSHAHADVVESARPTEISSPFPRHDEERIVAALKKLGPTTKAVLQREVRLPAADLTRTLAKLRQNGLVFLSGKGAGAKYFLAARKEPETEAMAPAS
jgi:hypothetical protein